MKDLYNLSSYDYDLPSNLIAQTAHTPADECKMLYFRNGQIKDLIFKDIKNLLTENDVLFFNNSKVVKARIIGDLGIDGDFGDNWILFENKDNISFYFVDKDWNKKECSNCEILFLKKIGDLEIKGDLGEKKIEIDGDLREKSEEVLKKLEEEGRWKKKENFGDGSFFEALVRPWKKFKIWKRIIVECQEDGMISRRWYDVKKMVWCQENDSRRFQENKKGSIKTYEFEVVGFSKEWRIIKYLWKEDIFEVLEKIWKMPLPPYISYSKDKEKPYQPVQAKKEGSVAAPTASLHFTKKLFEDLEKKWVKSLESTLHIWMWTFKTVDIEDITKYEIHSETVEIPIDIFKKIWKLKESGKHITAVWTTATRILESLPYLYKKLQKIKNEYFDKLVKNISLEESEKFIDGEIFVWENTISFDTKLYIYPWFKYKLVDNLITNFHLPKSSLLMLVSAFMWYDEMKKAYKHAIEKKYRFFSFWDAMFIHLK